MRRIQPIGEDHRDTNQPNARPLQQLTYISGGGSLKYELPKMVARLGRSAQNTAERSQRAIEHHDIHGWMDKYRLSNRFLIAIPPLRSGHVLHGALD